MTLNRSDAVTQMPQYQSHKRVWALKIKRVSVLVGGIILGFEDAEAANRSFTLEELKGKPTPSPGGTWFSTRTDI